MVGVTWQEKRNGWIGVDGQTIRSADTFTEVHIEWDVPERSDAVAVQLAWYEGELALHVRTDEWAVLTKRTALDLAASIIRLASRMDD